MHVQIFPIHSFERAFAIDEVNLGEAIGEYHMTALMEIFFSKVSTCDNADFRYSPFH